MEHQIILLPREDYWSWVRACRDYVMRYGPNLTKDPGTAGRYMFPAQVVTVPRAAGSYALEGDIEEWFQVQFPGVRVDVIEADHPKQLKKEFRLRLDDQDRSKAKTFLPALADGFSCHYPGLWREPTNLQPLWRARA